jgi:hypothetical protein
LATVVFRRSFPGPARTEWSVSHGQMTKNPESGAFRVF